MEILSYISFIYQKLNLFIIVLTRVSAMFSVFVLFRSDFVNPRILITLSVMLSLFIMLFHPGLGHANEVFSAAMVFECIYQFLIGFFAGFILNIVFEIFNVAGQIISTQIGLSLDSLFDPRLGMITSLTRFYFLAIALIFLLLNGHLVLIKTLMNSFDVFPVGGSFMQKNLLNEIVQYSSVIFSGGISMALTIVIAMLLVNLSLAVMTRFAPQFNVFSIGTNLSLVLGGIFILLTFHFFVDRGESYVSQGLDIVQKTLSKGK